MSTDRERASKYGDQLIECTVKKAAVEASLHSAQMLLLDIVDTFTDETLDYQERQLAVEKIHRDIRSYLMTSAWVLPPDMKLLASLSLVSDDGGGGGAGEDPPPPSSARPY